MSLEILLSEIILQAPVNVVLLQFIVLVVKRNIQFHYMFNPNTIEIDVSTK